VSENTNKTKALVTCCEGKGHIFVMLGSKIVHMEPEVEFTTDFPKFVQFYGNRFMVDKNFHECIFSYEKRNRDDSTGWANLSGYKIGEFISGVKDMKMNFNICDLRGPLDLSLFKCISLNLCSVEEMFIDQSMDLEIFCRDGYSFGEIENYIEVNELPHNIKIFNLGGTNFVGVVETYDFETMKFDDKRKKINFGGLVKITKFPESLERFKLSCCEVDINVNDLSNNLKHFHLSEVSGSLVVKELYRKRVIIENSPELKITYVKKFIYI
jgi:hypothetical protein